MVSKFTGYKASNGKTFDSEREAWGEELVLLVAPHIDNDAIARKLVSAVLSNPHEIAKCIGEIVRMTPKAAPPPPAPHLHIWTAYSKDSEWSVCTTCGDVRP